MKTFKLILAAALTIGVMVTPLHAYAQSVEELLEDQQFDRDMEWFDKQHHKEALWLCAKYHNNYKAYANCMFIFDN